MSFLQQKCENALHKAVNAINDQVNIQCNKLMKLDNTMVMYGIYNAEMLEKLIITVHEIHNATSSHEKLFAGEHDHSLFRILYTEALGMQQYATNFPQNHSRQAHIIVQGINHPIAYICFSH